MKYYIYKMIHVPSGRVYIGQHKLPKNKTPENDGYKGSGTFWRRIYNKHKDECIKVVIDYADSKTEIDELEKKYITHYKNVYGEFCVNITDGGEGAAGYKHTEEARRKMSEAKKGKPAWNKGIKMSDEQRKKCSEANKGRIPWHKGKIGVYSQESLKKMSESHIGKKCTLSKEAIKARSIKIVATRKKNKIPSKFKGVERTQEVKDKISNALKLAWKRRKEIS